MTVRNTFVRRRSSRPVLKEVLEVPTSGVHADMKSRSTKHAEAAMERSQQRARCTPSDELQATWAELASHAKARFAKRPDHKTPSLLREGLAQMETGLVGTGVETLRKANPRAPAVRAALAKGEAMLAELGKVASVGQVVKWEWAHKTKARLAKLTAGVSEALDDDDSEWLHDEPVQTWDKAAEEEEEEAAATKEKLSKREKRERSAHSKRPASVPADSALPRLAPLPESERQQEEKHEKEADKENGPASPVFSVGDVSPTTDAIAFAAEFGFLTPEASPAPSSRPKSGKSGRSLVSRGSSRSGSRGFSRAPPPSRSSDGSVAPAVRIRTTSPWPAISGAVNGPHRTLSLPSISKTLESGERSVRSAPDGSPLSMSMSRSPVWERLFNSGPPPSPEDVEAAQQRAGTTDGGGEGGSRRRKGATCKAKAKLRFGGVRRTQSESAVGLASSPMARDSIYETGLMTEVDVKQGRRHRRKAGTPLTSLGVQPGEAVATVAVACKPRLSDRNVSAEPPQLHAALAEAAKLETQNREAAIVDTVNADGQIRRTISKRAAYGAEL